MPTDRRPQAYRVSEASPARDDLEPEAAEAIQTIELREEQLVARKDLRELGQIEVRTEIDEVPGRLEVDAYREEVVVEHEPVGQVVSERAQPWEEDGTLIIPIYEEQLVVTKRLVLRERMRVRRVGTTERQLFQDTLRRERLVIEDPQHTGLVHEQYPAESDASGTEGGQPSDAAPEDEPTGGFLEHLVHRALQ